MTKQLTGFGVLFLVTLIWGTTFIAVKGALDGFAASWLVLARFVIASVLLAPLAKRLDRSSLRAGVELGLILCICYGTQAVGLQYTTTSRSAFITALFVVLVPLVMWFKGQPISRRVALASLAAFAGVGFLSFDGAPPNIGDAITVLCALGYSAYIIRMEKYTKELDTLAMTLAQTMGVTAWASLWVGTELLITGFSPPEAVPWESIIYLAVIATALTTYLQTLGQKLVGAAQTAILYMLEPVWAAIFAYFILNEVLGWQGWLGATMIVVSTIAVQNKTTA